MKNVDQMNKGIRKKIDQGLFIESLIFFIFFVFGYFITSYPKILESNFIITLAGAAAGSGVILFIEYLRRQDELLRDINLCIVVLNSILSAMLSIKRQNILPLKKRYDENLALITEWTNKAPNLLQEGGGRIATDFRTFMPPNLEVDISLEKLKALVSHVPDVVQAVMYTRYYLAYFNQVHATLMEFHASFKGMPQKQIINFCYFFKRDQFSSDTSYKNTIDALSLHADDVLHFTRLAMKSIDVAGREALPFWLRNKILKSVVLDKYKHLMPSEDHVENTG